MPIRAYCKVHNENDLNNTEKLRTLYAIAMNSTGNLQGSYRFRFLSLATGKSINRRKWTELLPITDDVIARVHELARAENACDPAPNYFFEWAPNMPVDDLPAPEHQEPLPLPVLGGANNPDGNNDDEEEEEEEEEEAEAEEEEADGIGDNERDHIE